jgi:uncharacterized protein YprB with RNaseH-like and TPR domain
MPDSLRDRLKSLGVKVGVTTTSTLKSDKKYPIQEVLAGDFIQNAFGKTFLYEEIFPPAHEQGNTRLDELSELEIIARWAKTVELESLRSDVLVFLDTETTGLSGGTGTYVFLVGIGFQTSKGFKLQQFFLQDPGEESAFLTALTEALSGFKGIVSYNGKSFDIPILKTRYVLNGITAPFAPLGHIDLLPLARRLWKYRLTHRNLGVLETEILGMARSSDEIPGWMIPEMYIDFCRNGDARPLKGVFYHNAMDIVSLAAVMFRVSQILKDGDRKGDFEGVDLMAAGELHQALGRISEAESFYISAAERPMQVTHSLLNRQKMAMMYKKTGNWEKAIPIFIELAESGQWEACCELAKYYEHSTRDYQTAKKYCQAGIEMVEKSEMDRVTRVSTLDDLHRRMERLELKESRIAKR